MRRFLPSQNFARTSLVTQVADGKVYPGSSHATSRLKPTPLTTDIGRRSLAMNHQVVVRTIYTLLRTSFRFEERRNVTCER